MPLLFNSINKGEIAFGFFNIETDMLLLENYFFFASDFCKTVADFAKAGLPENIKFEIPGYFIPNNKIGNLMGAIHGINFSGFIGEIYKIFPFPEKQEDFKQSPEGYKNREIVEKIIVKYGNKIVIPIIQQSNIFKIGEYEFTEEQLLQLINYVWVGGYPRWKDEKRPFYVEEMRNQIEKILSI